MIGTLVAAVFAVPSFLQACPDVGCAPDTSCGGPFVGLLEEKLSTQQRRACAAILRGLGHAREAERLLSSIPMSSGREAAALVRTLIGSGVSPEGAVKFFENRLRNWGAEEYNDMLGELDSGAVSPIRSLPEFHYALARRSEELGNMDLAAAIYTQFLANGVLHRDVVARYVETRYIESS